MPQPWPHQMPVLYRQCDTASSGQRLIGADAGIPGDAALIGDSSKLSSSVRKPAEHVGEHSVGVCGWRACGGSGGIAGGWMTSGGNGGGTLAQAVTSRNSTHSVSMSSTRGRFGDMGNPLCFVVAALLFGPRGLFGFERGLLIGLAFGLPLGPHLRNLSAANSKAVAVSSDPGRT